MLLDSIEESQFFNQIGLLDKLTYGGGSLDPTSRDPFSHMNASQPFGPPSMSMATMAALAAGMANTNGSSSPEEALALEMIRKTKGFFPGPQSLSR